MNCFKKSSLILIIAFANLSPSTAQRPDLCPNCLTKGFTWCVLGMSDVCFSFRINHTRAFFSIVDHPKFHYCIAASDSADVDYPAECSNAPPIAGNPQK